MNLNKIISKIFKINLNINNKWITILFLYIYWTNLFVLNLNKILIIKWVIILSKKILFNSSLKNLKKFWYKI